MAAMTQEFPRISASSKQARGGEAAGELNDAYLVAQEPARGLERAELAALPSPGTFTGVRNLLYAFEWWVFGGFAAFIWWRWRRDATAPEVTDLDRSAAG